MIDVLMCNCLRWWPTAAHHWPGCPNFITERDGPDCDHRFDMDEEYPTCRKCGYELWIGDGPDDS